MFTPFGQNFIARERSAGSEQRFKSLEATTGQPLPHDFYQARDGKVDRTVLAVEATILSIGN